MMNESDETKSCYNSPQCKLNKGFLTSLHREGTCVSTELTFFIALSGIYEYGEAVKC